MYWAVVFRCPPLQREDVVLDALRSLGKRMEAMEERMEAMEERTVKRMEAMEENMSAV